MSGKTLGDIIATPGNSFNAVRLLAAGAVFLSHSFLLLPFGDHLEPLDGAAYNLGQIAVNVFFFLSGMMLSRSYDRRPDPVGFALARALRIFPGLIVCGMVTAWIIGPLNTALPLADYFTQAETLIYPFSIPLIFNAASLPGVFEFGFEPQQVNTPLWTIKYELLAYIAFAAIAATGLLPKGKLLVGIVLLLGCAVPLAAQSHALDSVALGSLLRFGLCFALGHLAYVHRHRIPLSLPLAFAGTAASLVLLFTPIGAPASILGISYLAVVLGGLDLGKFGAWTQRTDLSYGVYLYAWPLQQTLIARFANGPIEAIALSLLAASLTVAVAWVSWTLVERPALALKTGTPRTGLEARAG